MTTFWTYVGCLRATHPRHGAEQRHEHDGEEPEQDQAIERRVRKAGEVRDREEAPRPKRDDLEDADDVVDRRVVAPLLVAVVQPVEPREQHPERERATKSKSSHFTLTVSVAAIGASVSAMTNATVSPIRSAANSSRRMSQPRGRRRRALSASATSACSINWLPEATATVSLTTEPTPGPPPLPLTPQWASLQRPSTRSSHSSRPAVKDSVP